MPTDQVTDQVTGQVTMEVALLMALTLPLNRQELQKTLGLKNADHLRKTYLLPALDVGLIEMTRPEATSSHLQQDCLTEKGRAEVRRQREELNALPLGVPEL